MEPQNKVENVELSILIVNWNSVRYLDKCLSSIYGSSTELKFEVIVVDNGSSDGSAELIPPNFPQIKFIQRNENLGFAKANNLAYRHSRGDILLFLNPDTEVLEDALCIMCSRLRSIPEAGALGCRLLNSDGSIQTSCVQSFPTIWNQVLDSDRLRNMFPRSPLWGTACLCKGEDSAPAPVDLISGACLMIKRAAFAEVGLFNEAFFMYAEDAELCHRLSRAGYKCYYSNEASIIHHGGRSSSAQPHSGFSAVLQKESLFLFLSQSRGSNYARLYRMVLGVSAAIRIVLIGASLPFGFLSGHFLGISNALRKWYGVLRWSIGLEIWLEPKSSHNYSRKQTINARK